MSHHTVSPGEAGFPNYIWQSLPQDEQLWVVIGVLGVGGKPSRGEMVVELLIAPADWRERPDFERPPTRVVEVGVGWTTALLPGTLLYNRRIVPCVDTSRRRRLIGVNARNPDKRSTRLGAFRPVKVAGQRVPSHPFGCEPELEYFSVIDASRTILRVPVFEAMRALFASHSHHIRHIVEGRMERDRSNAERLIDMQPGSFRLEDGVLHVKALADLTGHEAFVAAVLGDQQRAQSVLELSTLFRLNDFRNKKAFAKTVFPLIQNSNWEVDVEPVRVQRMRPTDAQNGDEYETMLITRIWRIEVDLGVREIVYDWPKSPASSDGQPVRETASVQELPVLADELLIANLQSPNRRLKPCDLAAGSTSLAEQKIVLTRISVAAEAKPLHRQGHVAGDRLIEQGSTADARGSKSNCAPVSFVNGRQTMSSEPDSGLSNRSHFAELESALVAVAEATSRTYSAVSPLNGGVWHLPLSVGGGAWPRLNGRGRPAFIGMLANQKNRIYVFDATRQGRDDGRCLLVLVSPHGPLSLSVLELILSSWAAAGGRWGHVKTRPLLDYPYRKLKHPSDEADTSAYSERIVRTITALVADGG